MSDPRDRLRVMRAAALEWRVRGLRAAGRRLAGTVGRLAAVLLDVVYPPVCLACGGAPEEAAAALLLRSPSAPLSPEAAPPSLSLREAVGGRTPAAGLAVPRATGPPGHAPPGLPGARRLRLCGACRAGLAVPALAGQCPRCGAPAGPYAHVAAQGCRACGGGRRLGVARAVVIGPYGGTLARLVRRLKYHGREELGEPLGRLLAERVAEAGLRADVVVPVPMSEARRRERGFDHAERIADGLAAALGLGVARALTRVRETPPLFARGARERREALLGAFSVRERDAARVTGRRVLLVDDVITTGASLTACALALRAGGTREVAAAAVARRGGKA